MRSRRSTSGLATVVLARGLLDAGTGDREDRDAAAVRAAHLDARELAAAHEPEGPKEEVVGLKHWRLPWTAGGEVG